MNRRKERIMTKQQTHNTRWKKKDEKERNEEKEPRGKMDNKGKG